jgi:Xaa-Pro aminopeptidase
MNKDVIDRCVATLEEEDLDAIVAMSPENVAYLTGFVVPSQPILRFRHAAVVITRDGRRSVLAIDMEATTVKNRLPDEDVHIWQEFQENAMPVFADLLTGLGLASGTIGIETDYVPIRDWEKLTALLPEVRWVASHPIFNRLRMVKTPRELDLMRNLARITDRSIKEALESVKAGDTEMDLAGAVTTNLFRYGAQNFKWLILASGERSQFPNVGPTLRKLERGDLVRLEVFGALDGYYTGVCRTAVVQEASEEVQAIWADIVACRDLIFGSVCDGAKGTDIHRTVMARFDELGWPRMDFVGHGIGLFVHEDPYIGPDPDARLETGMVLGVEPVLLVPGAYGFQCKDIVAVGPDGCDVLSDVTDTDRLLVIE